MVKSKTTRLGMLAILLLVVAAFPQFNAYPAGVSAAPLGPKTSASSIPMKVDGTYPEDPAASDAGGAALDASVASATTSQVDWSKMGRTGLNLWGALDNAATRETVTNNAVALGSRLVRVHVGWSQIQPTLQDAQNGRFNWSLTDAAMDAAHAKGLNILALVTGVPGWAVDLSAPYGTSQDGPYNYYGGQYSATFYYQLMKRYTDRYYNPYGAWNGVVAWQLLNEPNEKWRGYNPNMPGHKYTEHYAAEMLSFYNTMYNTGITSKCPGCMIVNGADALNDWQPKLWLQEVMYWQMYNKVDAFAIHYYPTSQYGSGPDYQGSMLQAVTQFRADLNANGGSALPIVVTESGHASEYSGVQYFNEQLQASHDIYDLTQASSLGVKHFSVYNYADWWQTEQQRTQPHYTAGLVRKDHTRKPAFYAVKTFIYEIRDQPYLGLGTDVMSLPSDIRSYRFSSDRIAGGQCWVVWRTTDTNASVAFYDPTGTKLRAALDMNGYSLTVTRSNGYSYVTIGRSPVFLKWNP